MAATIDELTVNYEENGQVKVKELDKVVLTRGSWATIVYKFQEADRSGTLGDPKAIIRRYQKRNGQYIPQSKFKISSAKQARQIVEALQGWFPPEEA